jgi:hypothetical protein
VTLAAQPAANLPDRRRARDELNVVLAVAGSTQLTKHADVRIVGRQVRGKVHRMRRDRGKRCTVEREVPEGAYSQLPAWTHRDQWLYLVQMTIAVWFPEQIHRQVRVATLLKFAALVAAEADDDNGRNCWRVYTELAKDMGVTVETVRVCWRALERLGLAVQVAQSVAFSYDERMRIWRLERSKQRGHTPVYALVVPAAYARALTTGEHPGDLLAQAAAHGAREDAPAPKPAAPFQKLSAALSKLRSTVPGPSTPTTVQPLPVPADGAGEALHAPALPQTVKGAVDKSVDNAQPHPFKKLKNVDILGLPRSGPRCTLSAALALVSVPDHDVKSTASRAHNRGSRADSERSGGSAVRKHAQKRCAGSGAWFGPHRDIAFHLTRRVPWLSDEKLGKIATHIKRFTVPGLPRVWTPDDFITAMDRINRVQGRYSPGALRASESKVDQEHARHADAGAIREPWAVLKWYLEQLDPVNDHPRFELEVNTEHRARIAAARQAAIEAAIAAEDADTTLRREPIYQAKTTRDRVVELRRLGGLPGETAPRNRR